MLFDHEPRTSSPLASSLCRLAPIARASIILAGLLFAPLGCGGTTSDSTGRTGSGSGGTAASAGGAAGVGGSGSEQPLCEQYCDAVVGTCTGSYAVYTTRDVCVAVCATLPPGKEGDEGVNSVQCRLGHARIAAETAELQAECPGAGPGGDGVCGSNCEGFCSIAAGACPDSASVRNDCPDVCAQIPDEGGYVASVQSGYSVQCRLYHASAATLDPTIHCPHVDGNGPCAPATPP